MDFLSTFLVVYRFLNYLYETKMLLPVEPFDTVDIVTGMDPTIWLPVDGEKFISGDPAAIGDWKENLLTNGIDLDTSISSENIFEGLLTFIAYYKKEYNFNVQDCLDLLYEMKNNPSKHKRLWDKWHQICENSSKVPYNDTSYFD